VTSKFLSIVMVARGAQFEVSRRGSILELISSNIILVGLESVSVLVTSFDLTVLVFVRDQAYCLGCNRLSLCEI
jgi:hypothetical protein